MAAPLNEPLLREKLEGVGAVGSWSPGLIPALDALARGTDEFAAYRVNPIRFAGALEGRGASGARARVAAPQECIELFLVAARQGLFTMQWDLLCSGCGDLVERFDALSFMHSTYHCGVCQTTYETTLEDSIEVSFTLSPAVRDLAPNHPESLSPEDYYYRWLFNPGGLVPDGRRYVDFIREHVQAVVFVPSGGTVERDLAARPGVLTGYDGVRKTGFWIEVKGEPVAAPQPLELAIADGGWEASAGAVRPGPVHLTMRNRGSRLASGFLFCADPGMPQHPTGYQPFLSAKKLFTTQLFRDQFRGELLGGTDSLTARDLTFLFTDLTGSTALYEKIGDVKAYALVHQHFDTLHAIVRRGEGAVVKTIGDAVMATFGEPAAAVAAAGAMLDAIDGFNRARGQEALVLKIGVHRGPCIAVTSNDRLDYFGQTVNLAARIQALAEPEEVVVTDDVLRAEGVAGQVTRYAVVGDTVSIKGVARPVPVHRLRKPI